MCDTIPQPACDGPVDAREALACRVMDTSNIDPETGEEAAVSGPFETERGAREAARHIYDIEPTVGAWTEPNLALLMDVCADAGVVVGEYDASILRWLAGYEPSTCAVIAGLVTRAHDAGKAAGPYPERVMDTGDIDPETGEEYGGDD
jgi:hypothetical protein